MAKACTHEGSTARIGCATCGQQICSRCLVETRVGFKCQEHGRLSAVAPAPGAAGGPKAAKAARTGGRGGGGFGIRSIVGLILLVLILPVGLGFLFAATGDEAGFGSVLPLIGFFVFLAILTTVAVRKLVR